MWSVTFFAKVYFLLLLKSQNIWNDLFKKIQFNLQPQLNSMEYFRNSY